MLLLHVNSHLYKMKNFFWKEREREDDAKSIWCRVHCHDSARRRFPNDEKVERR
jgi:hypothetical protein